MARKTQTVALFLTAGLGLAAGAAIAHDMKSPMPNTPAGKAIMARHDNFKKQGGAFKAINDELKKSSPDMAVIRPAAVQIKGLAAELPNWFPTGSGPESKLETDAKANVWADAAGFKTAALRFQTESAKFATVAASGDLDSVKAGAKLVGGACKNCHDTYRVPQEH